MKKIKFILCLIITVCFPFVFSIICFSTQSDKVFDGGREVEINEYNLKYNTNNDTDYGMYANTYTVNIDFSLYYDDSLNRDNELDLKHSEVMNEEEKKNKRDIKAYHIVAEHFGNEHNRNTLIDNIDDDVKIMKIMVDLLDSNNLNKYETNVISLYIIRRIDLVDNINDKNYLIDAYLKCKEQIS